MIDHEGFPIREGFSFAATAAAGVTRPEVDPDDVGLSRATYLEALSAAMFAGRLAGPGASSLDVSCAIAAAPAASGTKTVAGLLLLGFATHFTRYAAGLPQLREATAAFTDQIPADE